MDMIRYKMSKLNISQRKDGRFHTSITENGKRKDFYGSSKSEVKRKAEAYLTDIENGYFIPERIKLADYMEYWLKNFKWNYIEPSSYTRLYRSYETNVKDGIGQCYIGDVTREMVQELINEHANPMTPGIRAFSISGLKKLLQLLDACYRKAIEQKIVCENPCKGVRMPSESYIVVETREQFSLNDKEILSFKEAALARYKHGEYKSRDAIVLLIMLNLGLRVGEALALEWDDFDMEEKKVVINKTIQSNVMFVKDDSSSYGARLKKSPKTSAGIRVLMLNEMVIGYLNELKAYDKRRGIKSSFFCSTGTGTRNTARNMQRSLDRLTSQTCIKRHVTLHTLRHTFGSTMLRRGVPIEVVSKVMGHANVTVTYTKYIHVLQEQQAQAMCGVVIC